jgi:HEAT repeat protein
VVRLGHPFCFGMIHIPMFNKITAAAIVCLVLASTVLAQTRLVHQPIVVTIMQAEDERRWSNDLMQLLANQSPVVRKRAALAAGRIGDEGAVGRSRTCWNVTLTRAFARWLRLRSVRSKPNLARIH